jgi:trehalose/maltose hydrolase-like predicted phosphorylase
MPRAKRKRIPTPPRTTPLTRMLDAPSDPPRVTALDGRVTNGGVARYGDLEGRHLDAVSPRTFGPEIIALHVETRQSNIYVAQAARTRVFREDEQLDVTRNLFQAEDYIQQVVSFDVQQGESVRVEKLVSLYTSRDRAIYEPLTNAGKSVGRYPDFAEALCKM